MSTWPEVRLGRILRLVDRTGFPDAELLSVYREHGVIRKRDRADNFNKPGLDLGRYQLVARHDLVINRMKAWQGSLGVSSYDGIVSPDYYVAALDQGVVDPRFFHHLVRSAPLIAAFGAASTGIRSNQWRLPWTGLRDVSVRLPVTSLQHVIADALDLECARIASLLAKAERLGVVVREVQQAELDSYFVPYGHGTATTRLHRVLRTRPSYGVLVPQLVDEGVPFIRVGDLDAMRRGVELEVARIPETQSSDYRRTVVETGDVLVSVVGSIDKAAVVPPRLSGANVARAVARLQPALVPPDVLLAWTRSTHYTTQARLATSADTAQPTLNIGDLAAFEIALPATAEAAQRLTQSIESHRKRQDNADDVVQRLKLGLTEYRDALITEVVTGQLDITAVSDAQLDERAHAAAEGAVAPAPSTAQVG